MTLMTDFNLGQKSDDLYAALLEVHQGLAMEESAALNARLVLILMNHIGNPVTIQAALKVAVALTSDRT